MLELGERASAEAETEEDLDSHHQVMGETGQECRDAGPAPGYIKCPWSGGENNFFLSHHITHFVTGTSRQSTSVTVRLGEMKRVYYESYYLEHLLVLFICSCYKIVSNSFSGPICFNWFQFCRIVGHTKLMSLL